MKTKTKKKQRKEDAFDAAVTAYFRALGAVDNDGWWSFMYPLKLETKAGELVIHSHGNWVAMRFADVERAKALLPHGPQRQTIRSHASNLQD